MKKFLDEHRPHIVVIFCLFGHQVLEVIYGVEFADHYALVYEVLHVIFLG